MTSASANIVIEAARAFIVDESDAVRHVAQLVDDTFVRVATHLLEGKGKVVITGAGTSGFIARRAAHLCSVAGTPAFFLNPTDGLHGSMGVMRPDDVLIALSKGGDSAEVNDLAVRVKDAGSLVIALTSSPSGALAGLADIVVKLEGVHTADPGGLIAMGSTLAYGAWLDALAYALMRARQYSWEAVHYTHPGGAVGGLSVMPEPVAPLQIRSEADTETI
ncbi:MAG: SIS domain-containing protein [Microbacterium sp.]